MAQKTTTTKKTTKAKTFSVKAKPKAKAQPKPLPNLPPQPFVFEVLDLVSRQRAKAKKIEVLKKYEEFHLKTLFIWNFDDSVISLLQPGEVPYYSLKDEQNNSGTLSNKVNQQVGTMQHNNTTSLGTASDMKQGHTTIRREYTKFYNFIKGGNNSINGLRRETMFINLLTGLHPLDAEILCLVKDKDLTSKYKTITKDIVSQAYPQITWGGRS